ncbi:hypothetical protein [Hyphomicrobium sp.]|jgi:hypothetical protein|uniref:hypothetical protein n=1 Tax=Hyphomicrobium sp. TaxID=82 RepID=UPI000F9080C7|nr:hypothetical protein [Hyphomicrobium sp.]RUO97453.1 MAG: hypothetical protein EKK30_16620 [Hyphomicrobium sp.]
MRLVLIAVAMALAWAAGMSSAEARPYKGHGDRYERSAHWAGKRSYSRHYAQRVDRQDARRQYSYRRSGYRYAYRSGERRSYAYSGRVQRQYGQRRYAQRHYYSSGRRYASSGSVGGRPRAWCGWWMRTQLGGGPEYNLAANWRHYGRPSGPRVGAVVVWPHHVGMITGRSANGQWIVKSGNDGNAVRERPMSVAGAVFRSS